MNINDFNREDFQAVLALIELAWKTGSIKSEDEARYMFTLKNKCLSGMRPANVTAPTTSEK